MEEDEDTLYIWQ